MNKLKLRSQLIIIFTLVILAFSGVLFFGLDRYSKELALSNAAEKAELLLAHQRAIRSYTIENLRPILSGVESDTFISEQIPAFSAQTVMGHLNRNYPGYDYREAVENPTNPADRLEPWEEELLEGYRSGQFEGRQTRERTTPGGRVYSIADPIIVSNPACLACHGSPEAAPASLRASFPDGGGFGWRLNTPLGIQSITVPIEEATLGADEIRLRLIGAIALGLLLTLITLAFIVHFKVSGPINRLSLAASKLSMGNRVSGDDFPDSSAEMTDIKLSLRRLITMINLKMKGDKGRKG